MQWLWDRPPVKRLRITISMAQWTVRLPALLALIATQVLKSSPTHRQHSETTANNWMCDALDPEGQPDR